MIQNSQQKLWEIHKDEKKVTKVILCHFLFYVIVVKIISVREMNDHVNDIPKRFSKTENQ